MSPRPPWARPWRTATRSSARAGTWSWRPSARASPSACTWTWSARRRRSRWRGAAASPCAARRRARSSGTSSRAAA
eukprot:152290-Alexandrium_andersonii.AAC.1